METEISFNLLASLIIFILVYGMIVFRHFKGINIPIWVSMAIGAVLVLITQMIQIKDAINSINFDVIFFLLGMFILVSGLESSGALNQITNRILHRAKSPRQILFFILFGIGLMSAFLINDTMALIATPIVIGIALKKNIRTMPLLVSLAFGITIGSMMTPMGNPQNLLISLHSGIEFPLFNFLKFLILPTLACLTCTYFILTYYFKKDFSQSLSNSNMFSEVIVDNMLAKKSAVILVLTIIGFFALGLVKIFGIDTELNFSHIALFGGLVLLGLSNKKMEIIRKVNWQIIVFFGAMFVFMAGLWNSGLFALFQNLLPFGDGKNISFSIVNILGTSIVGGQIFSNVPFVALYLPALHQMGLSSQDALQWIFFAASCTISGNLTILGAASNVIILEEAAKRKVHAFSFKEFFKIGSIVTTSNVLILAFFIFLYGLNL